MEELHACRVCLATDTVLFNIHDYNASEHFAILMGFSIPVSDLLPQYICNMCFSLLCKFTTFRKRCRVAQEVLNDAICQRNILSTDYIRTIDRNAKGLVPSLRVVKLEDISNVVHPEYSVKEEKCDVLEAKLELTDLDGHEDNIDMLQDNGCADIDTLSDDEPLSKLTKDLPTPKPAKRMGRKAFGEEFATVMTLTKEQQLEEVQARRSSLNFTNSPYKCDKCYKGFIEEAAFKNHMLRHDPSSGDFVCDICAIRCVDDRRLRSHVVAAHERKFICKQCTHVSNTSNQAREHEKWHRGFTYNCRFCGETFRRSTTHLTHVRLHHPTEFVCELCGESFIGAHGLSTHKKRTHKDNQAVSSKAESYCGVCEMQFQSVEAFSKHSAAMHIHNTVYNKCCRHCGDCFETEVELRDHVKGHNAEQPVKCEQCNTEFSSARKCAAHYRRMHLGIKYSNSKNIVCEICGRKCASKATLAYHQRTHTGEKPYQCSVCTKRFSVRQRLQIHARTHTGERPYPCPLCPKAFRHKPALNRHSRVHSGVKPYPCKYCGKAFSQSNSMKLHVHTVHLKLPPPYRAGRGARASGGG